MSQIIVTILVVLGLPTRARDLIAFVKAVIAKMANNPNFTTPTPTLATVSSALAAYETAETAMQTTKGVKGDRAAKRSALVATLRHLRDYVQQICEANVENALAIAESANMRLRSMPVRIKAALTITQGLVSGTVVCDAKAVAKQATYYFCYSVDEKNWVSVPETMKSKVTISGLTPGQTYYFRFRALTRKGMGDPSQIVSFLVK